MAGQILGLGLLLLHALVFRESFVRDTDWAAATVRRWLPALCCSF